MERDITKTISPMKNLQNTNSPSLILTGKATQSSVPTSSAVNGWTNDFYGIVYSANYRSERLQMSFGSAVNKYVGDHFGRVMWVKNAEALPSPDYEYYRNRGEQNWIITFT